MNNWRQILSWSESNIIPVNSNTDNETKFISLIVNDLRKRGYNKYITIKEIRDFLTGWIEDMSVEEIFSIWISALFSNPQRDAKDWAYTFLDMKRDDEEEI